MINYLFAIYSGAFWTSLLDSTKFLLHLTIFNYFNYISAILKAADTHHIDNKWGRNQKSKQRIIILAEFNSFWLGLCDNENLPTGVYHDNATKYHDYHDNAIYLWSKPKTLQLKP